LRIARRCCCCRWFGRGERCRALDCGRRKSCEGDQEEGVEGVREGVREEVKVKVKVKRGAWKVMKDKVKGKKRLGV